MGKLVQGRSRDASDELAGRRGAMRMLPALPGRDMHAAAVMFEAPTEPIMEPGDITPSLVSGALALLEAPAVEREPLVRAVPVRHHILIVEDDARTVDVVRNALELDGEPDWGVECAGDGLRALELAARVPPDVVLLDVRLPGLDGGEVYRRLRAANDRARVLFLSAGTALDLARQGIEDGVLLRKPFQLLDLVELVRALLAE